MSETALSTPLALVKAHLRIDHDADDALLTHYAQAAEWWIGRYTGRGFMGSPVEVQAVLLMVGHSYEVREAATFARPFSVPYGVEDLLSPLKRRITGAHYVGMGHNNPPGEEQPEQPEQPDTGHTHDNLTVLDKLGEDDDGLTYDGQRIGGGTLSSVNW